MPVTDTTVDHDSFADQERSLHERVAFVTGGTRGIGAAISANLAAKGAKVVSGYRKESTIAEKFESEMAERGLQVQTYQCDTGVSEECEQAVRDIVGEHGSLDILVNNAGITMDRTVAKMSEDEWDRVISVNLSGYFFLAKHALSHMIENGFGRIINVSSIIGEIGAIGQANYAASKAGVLGLTKTLAREACFQLERQGKTLENGIGVTVNAVTPGYVLTEMVQAIPEKIIGKIKDSIPVGRLAKPDEVARVVRFLAEDESSYITGQTWGVNGGLDM